MQAFRKGFRNKEQYDVGEVLGAFGERLDFLARDS